MKPNILLLMTDQQRFDAMSCHGGAAITPNLDRLSSEGVDLQSHFANAPVCVPSRCNLFTGRYPAATRVRENDARLSSSEIHLFKLLKESGYFLSYIGKNHCIDNEEIENFDFWEDFKEVRGSEDPPMWDEYLAYKKARGQRNSEIASWASADFHSFPEDLPESGRIGILAEDQIRRAPADRPFFILASFSDPHAPHIAPERFESWYPPEQIQLPEVPRDAVDEKAPRYRIKREVQGSLKANEADRKRYLQCYYAMCSYVDDRIGRILEALNSRQDADNTIVVFLSDHGDFNWHYDMHKKDLVLCDHLLHVPFVIRWPKRFRPQVVHSTLTEHVDLMPTLLELAEMDVPRGVQGKSLVPLLEGRRNDHKDAVYAEVCYDWMHNPFKTGQEFHQAWERGRKDPSAWPYEFGTGAKFNLPGEHNRMVRTRKHKLVWYLNGFEELYDLETDPGEFRNLALLPEHQKLLDEMRLKLFQGFALRQDFRSPLDEARSRKRFAFWKTA